MLQITHKEESGFHYLQSLITFYGKGDQVEVAANNAFSLTVKGEFGKDLPIEGNLVLKAAEWLGGLYPDQSKASVILSKNLPLSSGIGGGSSDAAATIAALLDLWGIDLNYSEKINLIKASAILGADIPVCLAYHLLGQNFFWIDGTGKEGKPEALWEEDFKEIYLLLVNPGIAVSTPSIFKAYDKIYDKIYDKPIMSPTSSDQLLSFLKRTKNSLTSAARELVPEISEVLRALNQTPSCLLARMSGSGATCFGLYDNPDNCMAAGKAIKESHPKWWVMT